jgi:hypothetical protein
MKDLGKTKFCLGLQIEHLQTGIFVHQFAYVKKVLEKFNMNKAYPPPQRTLMIVRALKKDKDPFRLKQEGGEVLRAECPYLSAIGALMYLANNTRSDIAVMVNYLTRQCT